MASSTVEDYLKRIYLLESDGPSSLVLMGRLAEAMGVAPGTATSMIKTLSAEGLVEYEPRGGVCLTVRGGRLALHVVRRHRLVELLLVEVLGLDWSKVHEEAEQLEHAISDMVMERIDALLGHPAVDPHGDPIPSARGCVKDPSQVSLRDCKSGRIGRISRVADQDARFLQFVDRSGLVPGVEVTVDHHDELADAVTVQPEGRAAVTIGTRAASKIFVENI